MTKTKEEIIEEAKEKAFAYHKKEHREPWNNKDMGKIAYLTGLYIVEKMQEENTEKCREIYSKEWDKIRLQ